MFVRITGTGSYMPQHVVTNDELATRLDTSDDWIFSHTGVRSRHIAADHENTSTMAAEAARAALASAGLTADQLGLIIVATSTADYHAFPSTACLVQEAIGAKNAAAFDVQAACTGFICALEAARGMMQANPAPTLVIGAEMMSRIVDWNDRNTCILFGDAAGAVVLESDEAASDPWYSILKADGSGARLIYREGGTRIPEPEQNMQYPIPLSMKGHPVFNFAIRVLDEVLRGLLDQAGLAFGDLGCVIPHQANAGIVEAVARRMNVPLDAFFMNVETTGNTSAASVPVALDEAVRSGRIKPGDWVAMAGFGAGLTYGGLLMRWSGKPIAAKVM